MKKSLIKRLRDGNMTPEEYKTIAPMTKDKLVERKNELLRKTASVKHELEILTQALKEKN